MSNELIPQEVTGGALANHDFDDAVSGGNFLPRLQLYGSKSDACAEQKIPIGHWGLVKDKEITDLGEELDAVIVSWRPKALQTGANLVTNHDPKSDTYQQIKTASFTKDSGCMFGPEFLLWVPSQNQFLTYFASSPTARREAKKAKPLIGQAATFKCHLIDNGTYKWHGPLVMPCSTPLEVPDIEVIKEENDRFQNPQTPAVELAPEGQSTGRER